MREHRLLTIAWVSMCCWMLGMLAALAGCFTVTPDWLYPSGLTLAIVAFIVMLITFHRINRK